MDRVTSVPGCPLHCPRHCLLWKYTSLVNQNMLFTAFLVGKLFSKKKKFTFCQEKSFSLKLAHPLRANGFFQPCIILFPEINVFLSHERWWPLYAPCWGGSEGIRDHSSQVPALTSKCALGVGCRGWRQVAEVLNRWCSD